MNSKFTRTTTLVTLGLAMALLPHTVLACAACYGQSDSPMAAGMNWGILSLLGIIVVVLGAVAAFFIFLARRSAALAKSNAAAAMGFEPLTSSADAPHAEEDLQALPLAPRGGLKRVSTLAQLRERCAQPKVGPGRLAAPRGRNPS